MREAVFTIIDAAPAKVGNILAVVLGLWGVGDPDGFQQAWGAVVSAKNIRIVSALALFLCAAYWLLWFWLKPIAQVPKMAGDTFNFTHSGSGHNIHADTVNFGPSQRSLDDPKAAQFKQLLSKLSTDGEWTVEYQQGDREAAVLAKQVKDYLGKAGVPVRNGFLISMIFPEQYGISIRPDEQKIIIGHHPSQRP